MAPLRVLNQNICFGCKNARIGNCHRECIPISLSPGKVLVFPPMGQALFLSPFAALLTHIFDFSWSVNFHPPNNPLDKLLKTFLLGSRQIYPFKCLFSITFPFGFLKQKNFLKIETAALFRSVGSLFLQRLR